MNLFFKKKESVGIVLESLIAIVEEDGKHTRMGDKLEDQVQCKDGIY